MPDGAKGLIFHHSCPPETTTIEANVSLPLMDFAPLPEQCVSPIPMEDLNACNLEWYFCSYVKYLPWYNLPSFLFCLFLLSFPAPPLRKVNTCKYPPIGSIIILPDDVYKSSKIMLPKCQSTTLRIKLCAFPTHLRCISEALLHTLMHCVSDSTCYATPHRPLHLCLHTCRLHLFVCLFTFVTGAHVACFVCLFPLLDWFH